MEADPKFAKAKKMLRVVSGALDQAQGALAALLADRCDQEKVIANCVQNLIEATLRDSSDASYSMFIDTRRRALCCEIAERKSRIRAAEIEEIGERKKIAALISQKLMLEKTLEAMASERQRKVANRP
jgi:hypothetical protein